MLLDSGILPDDLERLTGRERQALEAELEARLQQARQQQARRPKPRTVEDYQALHA